MAETPLERPRQPRDSTWPFPGARLALRGNVIAAAALVGIVLLGGLLRFHGLDWDHTEGEHATSTHQHPDERFLSIIAESIEWPGLESYFDTEHSTLNPLNIPDVHYVYGTLPLFAGKALASIAGEDSYEHTAEWGRRLTAFVDTLTILLVFGAGAVLFGRLTGLLGALFYALAVLPIQIAHFWTVDPYVSFFGMAAMLLCLLWLRSGRGPWLLLAGVATGLALACKVTAWPVAMLPVVAVLVRMATRDLPKLHLHWQGTPGTARNRDRVALSRTAWVHDMGLLAGCALLALLVFRIFQPYAWAGTDFFSLSLDPRWKDGLMTELRLQNGDVENPPFIQFAGATPWLTPLANMVTWGLGPALGLAGIAGCMAGAIAMVRRREMTFVLPLAYAAAIFLFQAPRFVAFMRYFAPMYPVLCIMAAWLLVAMIAAAPATRRRVAARVPAVGHRVSERAATRGAVAVVGAVVVLTAFWAFAFQAIYSRPHTRVSASEWIYANVPAGEAITWELWDDRLPLPLPGEDIYAYRQIETSPFVPDSPEKVQRLIYGHEDDATGVWVPGLDEADYVVLASDRIRGVVSNLERTYPSTIRYYELLDSGELGFELVETFTSRPSLFGLTIDDSDAEESFTVYDHPEVRIYRKTAAWDSERAMALLLDAHPERAVRLLPRQGSTNGLLYSPEQAATQQHGGTFTDVFDADGWASGLPWLWWLLWLEIAGLAALSWSTWLFGRFPDRGYGLAKVCGVIAIVFPVWSIVAWGLADFSGAVGWLVSGGVVALSGGIAVVRRRSLVEAARTSWRSWLVTEAVFLAAFTAFLLLRAWNPDAWNHPLGGEKPMELAYLTAVARSTELPPYDPWFAGGYMNYYYMGWFVMAVPMRMFQIVPEVGLNLGVPTYAALSAAAICSLVTNLVALSPRAAAVGRPRGRAIATGALAVVMLMAVGNLDAAHQWIERIQSVNTWSFADGMPVLGGAVSLAGGLWQWAIAREALPPFDWWRSSRVHIGSFDITEFPFFSFLFGDLHPHVMDVPFFLLVVALASAYVVTAATSRDRIRPWTLAGALGFALGFVRTVHTWDFPTAVIVGLAAIAAGQLLARGRRPATRAWTGLGHVAVLGAALLIPFLPFTSRFETFSPGMHLSPETTPPQQYFAHFGLFVVVAALFIALRYREERQVFGGNIIAGLLSTWPTALCALIFAGGAIALAMPFNVVTIVASGLVIVLLGNLAWMDWRQAERDVPRLIATLLFALAFAIGAGVDVVTLNNDIERMNTVFKFSLQAWHLFTIASAFAVWYIFTAFRFDALRWRPSTHSPAQWTSAGAVAAITLFLLAAGLYPGPAINARQPVRFDTSIGPTLNGLAYLEQGNPVFIDNRGTDNEADDLPFLLRQDLPLIEWLRQNVEGSPVIVEAVGPLYSWSARMSVNTGLPTVIGWDWHQVQQRTDYLRLVQQRRRDTALFYSVPDVDFAEQYLRRYNVSYIIVGTQERAYGTPDGLAKFEVMPALKPVFRDGDSVIYRVDQASLPLPISISAPERTPPQGPIAPGGQNSGTP